MCTGGDSLEVKTEADDVSECPLDDEPSTGVLGICILFSIVYHLHQWTISK